MTSANSLNSFRTQQELAAVPIPGGWTWQTEELGERRCELLLPANGEAFLAAEANDQNWPDPFWTEIWPAARSLAAIVLARPWPPGTKVLELGCGNGFVGLAALVRGCDVTFSDYVPLAVELALANAAANGFAESRGCVLDWRNPAADQRYEVILAADVLYDPELHMPLLETLADYISPTGKIWLGDPSREATEQFFEPARDTGWQITVRRSDFTPNPILTRDEFQLLELRRL